MAEVIYPNWENRSGGVDVAPAQQARTGEATKGAARKDRLTQRQKEPCDRKNGTVVTGSGAVVSQRFERSCGSHASGLLERTIEAEIIPRLMLAHSERDPALLDGAHGGRPMSQAVAEQFRQDVMTHSADSLAQIVEALYRGGMPLREIHLYLLGPAAAYAGQLWKEDRASFVDVTLALNRLHQVVHRLRAILPPMPTTEQARRLLLTTVPGEQHSFGVTLLTDLFRQECWTVYEASGDTADTLCARITRDWFDCIGLSASSGIVVDTIAPLVERMRQTSLNPDVRIIAGGKVLGDTPDLAETLGVDAIINDADDALATADSLVNQIEDLTERTDNPS